MNNSIIFYLDQDLLVYRIFVNEFKDDNPVNLSFISQVKKAEKGLNLAEKFGPLWASLWQNYLIETEEIYFWLGPNSGFTDSRIVFLWLRSWQMFFPTKKFFVQNLTTDFNLLMLNSFQIQDLINKSRQNCHNLNYSREPRLGRN